MLGYNFKLSQIQQGKTLNAISKEVKDETTKIVKNLVNLNLPIAYNIEDMEDDSVRLSWWSKLDTRSQNAVFVDIYEAIVIVTCVTDFTIHTDVTFKLKNKKQEQKLFNYLTTHINLLK